MIFDLILDLIDFVDHGGGIMLAESKRDVYTKKKIRQEGLFVKNMRIGAIKIGKFLLEYTPIHVVLIKLVYFFWI